MIPSTIVAIVPTYNPEIDQLGKALESISSQVQAVIVVDDGSEDKKEIRDLSHEVTFISLNSNMGQAHALNAGVTEALKLNPEWILTLDQDSILEDDAISSLGDLRTKNPNIGIICMSSYYPRGVFSEQPMVITNGNLVRANIYKSIAYRESFFIDLVDFDFCFKVRKLGYKIMVFGGGISRHNWGRKISRGKHVILFEPHERFYYHLRNSTVMVREGSLPFMIWAYWNYHLIWSLFMAEGFKAALVSLFWGLTDGLLGRLGKMRKPGSLFM
jgi:rhamnosyltransferase